MYRQGWTGRQLLNCGPQRSWQGRVNKGKDGEAAVRVGQHFCDVVLGTDGLQKAQHVGHGRDLRQAGRTAGCS